MHPTHSHTDTHVHIHTCPAPCSENSNYRGEREAREGKKMQENIAQWVVRHPKGLEWLLLIVCFNRRAMLFLLYSNTFGAILVSFSCKMAQLSPSQMKAEKMVGGRLE